MNAIKNAGTWLKRATTLISVITYAGFFAIMLLIVADVTLRKLLNSPIPGAYEIVQYALMASVFASFAYCQSERGHVHITMIIRLMPQKLRFAAYSFTGLLSAVIAGYLGYAAIRQANQAFEANYTTGLLKFAVFPFFWIMAITMFLFTVAIFFDVIRSVIAIFNRDFADEIQKDWS
ncbi:MAG: TRAP transporter small permease [Oscillospiraceae bacterium]|nr:TRAP transporter small permease [Oscillospiraceae bacterium]